MGDQRGRQQNGGRCLQAHADADFALAGVVEIPETGVGKADAYVDVVVEPAEIAERADVDGATARGRIERQRLIDAAEHGAVLRRDRIEVLDRALAARAGHVLRDDRRISGDMLAKEFGGEAGVEIVSAADAVADDQSDLLACVEIRHRIGAGLAWKRNAQDRKQESPQTRQARACATAPSPSASPLWRTAAASARPSRPACCRA